MDAAFSRTPRRASSRSSSCASTARWMRSWAGTTHRRAPGCTPRTTTSAACRRNGSAAWKGWSMSSSIWTQCAAGSELRPLRLEPWRVVEAQHRVSTRKLVDSAAEQAVLEELIEGSKPPIPADGRLHHLLATPFGYPRLRHGSRFRTRHERGIWYGSESRRTAFAEVAYYRLLFLEGTRAELGPVTTQLT